MNSTRNNDWWFILCCRWGYFRGLSTISLNPVHLKRLLLPVLFSVTQLDIKLMVSNCWSRLIKFWDLFLSPVHRKNKHICSCLCLAVRSLKELELFLSVESFFLCSVLGLLGPSPEYGWNPDAIATPPRKSYCTHCKRKRSSAQKVLNFPLSCTHVPGGFFRVCSWVEYLGADRTALKKPYPVLCPDPECVVRLLLLTDVHLHSDLGDRRGFVPSCFPLFLSFRFFFVGFYHCAFVTVFQKANVMLWVSRQASVSGFALLPPRHLFDWIHFLNTDLNVTSERCLDHLRFSRQSEKLVCVPLCFFCGLVSIYCLDYRARCWPQ